jgi:hypothetical protein
MRRKKPEETPMRPTLTVRELKVLLGAYSADTYVYIRCGEDIRGIWEVNIIPDGDFSGRLAIMPKLRS